MGADETRRRDDERLIARAEEALTQIKVSTGLSEPHAAVLAALRIRLRGDAGGNLEDMLAAAEDAPDGSALDDAIRRSGPDQPTSLDDLLTKPQQPKRSLDDLLG